MEQDAILKTLCEEIAVIAGVAPDAVDPALPMRDNGIDSMGFIALLAAVRRVWGLDFISGGLDAADSASPDALARRIRRELTA